MEMYTGETQVPVLGHTPWGGWSPIPQKLDRPVVTHADINTLSRSTELNNSS